MFFEKDPHITPWLRPPNQSYNSSKTGYFPCICIVAGVSIKFEGGSWLEKNNRLYEQGGSGGMLPQKILKSGSSEMPFPAFWAPSYHASTPGNYSVCMAMDPMLNKC